MKVSQGERTGKADRKSYTEGLIARESMENWQGDLTWRSDKEMKKSDWQTKDSNDEQNHKEDDNYLDKEVRERRDEML